MNYKTLTAILFLAFASLPVISQDIKLDNIFYCFNNGVTGLQNAPQTMEEQASLIKKLGYDGLGGHASQDNLALRAALDKAGVAMPEVYFGLTLSEDGSISYAPELKDIIKASKDRNLLVALTLNSKSYMDNKAEGDKLFAEAIGELADFCAPYQVKIAIYPHVKFYCEESFHPVEIAKLVHRENVGVIFNTCHFLKVEGEKGWKKKVKKTLPYLYMVSINGADSGDTQNMGWDQLIQPLGEGSFDTYKLVKYLKDSGYEGMFGLQCYGIKQDCEVALGKSIATWKSFQKKYAAE